MNLLVYNWTGTKPLIGIWLCRSEMLNEIVVTLVSLHVNFFTDWVIVEETKMYYGWSMITIIVLHMLL